MHTVQAHHGLAESSNRGEKMSCKPPDSVQHVVSLIIRIQVRSRKILERQ